MNEIEQHIISIVAKMRKKDPSTITNQLKFTDDLGMDSLDTVEIVIELEDIYGIELDEKNAQDIITINDLSKKIKQELDKKKSVA